MSCHRLDGWAPRHRAPAGPFADDRTARYVVATGFVLILLSVFAVYLLAFGRTSAGAVPGRGVHTIPTPGPNGGFTTMPNSMYRAPVVPGASGARRAPLAATAARAARKGEPGHLERLMHQLPAATIGTPGAAVWTIAARFRSADETRNG